MRRSAASASAPIAFATSAFQALVADAISQVGEGPVFLTVDVDVLDPAFAPGTGTPEPGGMTSGDLLWACREIASRVDLIGAERVVRETLTGVAVRAGERQLLAG